MVRPCRCLIWSIKETRDLKWVETELNVLQQVLEDMNLDINIFATQGIVTKIESSGNELHPADTQVKEVTSVESSGAADSRSSSLYLHQSDGINGHRRPDVAILTGDFLESTIDGPTIVFSSGLGVMISDVRGAVAGFNSPSRVWCGQQQYDLKFVGEDRMEIYQFRIAFSTSQITKYI